MKKYTLSVINKKVILDFIKKPNKKALAHLIKQEGIVYNVNNTKYEKNCLLLYIPDAFLGKKGDNIHQNIRQCVFLAECIGTYGYNIDVVGFNEQNMYFNKTYDMVVDTLCSSNDVYASSLFPQAKKVAYLTTCNPVVSNREEILRIERVNKKKEVELRMSRYIPELDIKIEAFDMVMFVGQPDSFSVRTYAGITLPNLHFIQNNGYMLKKIGHNYDYGINFMFFAGLGMVHKGLDLLLDVFSEKDFPFDLYICCLKDKNDSFELAYYKELYETQNIHMEGFVDINSEKFDRIVEICPFALFPSCADTMPGAVLTIMSAGIIPICSEQCGFFGDEVILFDDCSVGEIKNKIIEYGNKDIEWIEKNCENARNIAHNKYSFENYKKTVKNAFDDLMMK